MTACLDQLRRQPDARIVLIVADGLGSSNAANRGVYRSLREGVATSAGLQVPCPWARGAAADFRGEDIGVSLTVNAEHELYRWGPVTQAPSLLGGNGGFPSTAADLWEHADLEETRRECRSQIERAILWGFDATHLSAHLGSLCARPEFFDIYVDLALEFQLPISLPDDTIDLGFEARTLARDEGIVVPDREVAAPLSKSVRSAFDEFIREVPAGVTELHLRPADDTPELRAITPNWAARVSDAHLVTQDWSFRAALERSGAELIGYRELRDAQRSG